MSSKVLKFADCCLRPFEWPWTTGSGGYRISKGGGRLNGEGYATAHGHRGSWWLPPPVWKGRGCRPLCLPLNPPMTTGRMNLYNVQDSWPCSTLPIPAACIRNLQQQSPTVTVAAYSTDLERMVASIKFTYTGNRTRPSCMRGSDRNHSGQTDSTHWLLI